MKWLILFLLFVLNILNYTDKSIIGVAAADMMKDLGLNYEQWGLIGSSFYWLLFIATVLGGVLSDRFGPRRVLAYMAIVWSIAQFIPFVASNLFLLVFARLLLGFGEGPYYTVAISQMNRWFPQEQRGLATSIINVGAIVGKSVAIPLMIFLIVQYGWRVTFLITAFASLAWVIIWALVAKEQPAQSEVINQEPVEKPKEKINWGAFGKVLKNPSFLFPAIAIFAANWVVSFGLVFLPSYLTQGKGMTSEMMGTILAVGGLAGAALGILLSMLSDRMYKKSGQLRTSRVLFSGVGLIVAGISYYAITIFDSPILLMICYAIEAAFVSFLVAVMPQVVMTAMPGKPGTIIGFAMMIGSFSGVVGPLISGKMIEASGATQAGFSQAFLICGAICVLAGILVTLFTKPEAKKIDHVQTT